MEQLYNIQITPDLYFSICTDKDHANSIFVVPNKKKIRERLLDSVRDIIEGECAANYQININGDFLNINGRRFLHLVGEHSYGGQAPHSQTLAGYARTILQDHTNELRKIAESPRGPDDEHEEEADKTMRIIELKNGAKITLKSEKAHPMSLIVDVEPADHATRVAVHDYIRRHLIDQKSITTTMVKLNDVRAVINVSGTMTCKPAELLQWAYEAIEAKKTKLEKDLPDVPREMQASPAAISPFGLVRTMTAAIEADEMFGKWLPAKAAATQILLRQIADQIAQQHTTRPALAEPADYGKDKDPLFALIKTALTPLPEGHADAESDSNKLRQAIAAKKATAYLAGALMRGAEKTYNPASRLVDF